MTVNVARVPTVEWLREQRDDIARVAREHKASTVVQVFGSVARGEATADSDVDLLVEFEDGASLLDLAALEIALGELLGFPVDVMSVHGRGYAADHARRQAVPL